MDLVPGDRTKGLQTPVWRSYQSILFGASCTVRLRPHLENCTSLEAGRSTRQGPRMPHYSCPSTCPLSTEE